MAIFVQINAMARQNDMGREGESEARAYLVKHGYNVLHTNWHWHHYELDIIAVKEDEFKKQGRILAVCNRVLNEI